ncbi:MAG: FaeA/PapI family transcriptional regulator [Patescibacteria group bacterium]
MTSKERPETNIGNVLGISHLAMLRRIAGKIYYEAIKKLSPVDLETLNTLEQAGYVKNSLTANPNTGNVAFTITEAGKNFIDTEMSKCNARFAELAGNESSKLINALTPLRVGTKYSKEDIEILFDMRLNNTRLRKILTLCTEWKAAPSNTGYILVSVNIPDVKVKDLERIINNEEYLKKTLLIIEILKTRGEPMSTKEIADKIGISAVECKNKLTSLRNQQQVRTVTNQRKPGKTPTLWELTKTTRDK